MNGFHSRILTQICSELIFDHTLLRVLEHFRVAKVDYAKNVTKYTEIQRDTVNSSIRQLEEFGYLERYANTSIKKTVAKLKKSPEVHKHHTYFQITRDGIIALNSIQPRTYLEFLAEECLSCLEGIGRGTIAEQKAVRMERMGLIDRHSELTGLGRLVLNELRRK